MPEKRIRLLLAEEHLMVREGIAALLRREDEFEIVGETEDGAEAVSLAEALGPDVVVMGTSLRGLSGLDATSRIRKRRPDIDVIVLSAHDDAPTVHRALHAGARGFVTKSRGIATLVEAIRAVRRSEVFLSPDISDHVLQGYLHGGTGPSRHPLSEREREVLQLVAEGNNGPQIAERLGLRPKTVDNHRARIMEKLDIHTTAGLVRWAFRQGLV